MKKIIKELRSMTYPSFRPLAEDSAYTIIFSILTAVILVLVNTGMEMLLSIVF